jgi:hypothetical protein
MLEAAMPAEADIIVRSPDSTEVKLVVEAKLRVFDLDETERRLKNFMLQLRCPLGLLISPDRLWVYLDRFTSDSVESVERLGDFGIAGLLPFHSVPAMAGERAAASAFEDAVQDWLESLPISNTRALIHDPRLLDVIDHYVVPAIETGIVGAAGPR